MISVVKSETRSNEGDGEKKEKQISRIYGAYMPSGRVMIAIAALFFFLYCRFGSSTVSKYMSFETFKKNHAWLRTYARKNQVQTAFLFTAGFIPIITFMIPGAASLTLAAGTMFDQPMATFITAFASAVGACGAFLLARSTVGSHLRTQANKSPLMTYLRRHLEGESRGILLISMTTLRIVPFLPFWFVNVAPVVFDVHLKDFALSTLIGILPGTYVATQAGVILDDELVSNPSTSVGSLWMFIPKALVSPKMVLPLLILSLWVAALMIVRVKLGWGETNRSIIGKMV